MPTNFTRRQVAIGIAAGVAAVGQTPVPPTPQNPEEELKALQVLIHQNSETLAKVEVPQTTEPAFVFRP